MTQAITRRAEELTACIARWLELASVPGLALAVIEDGHVSWTGGYGVMSTATAEPVTSETVFQAASLSKPVFAYAVLRLCDQGLIDLDRPLGEYLAAPYNVEEPAVNRITARQALSHSSGLQNWRFGPDDRLSLSFSPGARFRYSGEGYYFLQCVVEQVTGQGFEGFMQEQMLRPLGMRHSSYIWLPEHEPVLAAGHRGSGEVVEPWNSWQGRQMQAIADRWQKPVAEWCSDDVMRALGEIKPELPPLPNNVIPNAAGSLLTTASEYARFVAQLIAGIGDECAAIRSAMFSPQIAVNAALAWGLGWGLEHDGDRSFFWQWGDNGAFKAFAFGEPARRCGLVVLTNSESGLKVCERIITSVMEHDPAAFLWL